MGKQDYKTNHGSQKELLALIHKRRMMFGSQFLTSYRKFLNKLTKSIAFAKKHLATLLETKKSILNLNGKSYDQYFQLQR